MLLYTKCSLYTVATMPAQHSRSRGVVTQLLNKRPLTLKRGLQSEEDTVTALCWVTVRHRKTQSSSVWAKIMLWSDHSQGAHTLAALTHLQKPKCKMALEKQLPMCKSLKSAGAPSPTIHPARAGPSWALCRPIRSSLPDSKAWHLWTEIPQHCVKIKRMVSRQQTPRIRGCVFGGGGTLVNEKICFSTCSLALRRDGKSLTPSFVMLHASQS